MNRVLPHWRSLLYVPTNVERFVASAADRGADAIILDLEDSIAPSDKAAARLLLPDAAARIAARGVDVVVRINRPLALAVADIEVAVSPHVRALNLPKVAGPEHLQLLSETVADIERRRGIPVGATAFLPLVETAAALPKLDAIAAAERVGGITLGLEDLTTDLGITPSSEAIVPLVTALVVAARGAGVLALGLAGSIAGFRDLDAFRRIVRLSRSLGIQGAACIHPAQVAVINEGFTPSEDEIARARRIVEAYDDALSRGTGAISLEGAMIDVPVAERARALLERFGTTTIVKENQSP